MDFCCRDATSSPQGAPWQPEAQPGSVTDAELSPSELGLPSARRCQEERARLQAELEQKHQEAERRDAMYKEELGGQRDLVQAMKMRVLELIQ